MIGQQKMITNIKLKSKGVVRYPSYLVFETFFNQLSIDFKCFKYTNPGFVLSTIFQKKNAWDIVYRILDAREILRNPIDCFKN